MGFREEWIMKNSFFTKAGVCYQPPVGWKVYCREISAANARHRKILRTRKSTCMGTSKHCLCKDFATIGILCYCG